MNPSPVQLDQYSLGTYSPGASLVKQILWYSLGDPWVKTRLLPSSLKVWLLRRFGTEIGQGVRIKPGVQIKFPWRLRIGNHCWIGENSWIDNVAPISLDDHVCLKMSISVQATMTGAIPSFSSEPRPFI